MTAQAVAAPTPGPRAAAAPADRVPDRVRERLATYQRGLRQGRHRAEPRRPRAIPPPGSRLLLVVPNLPVVAPRG